jgi:hypothetical protein
MAEVVRSVRKVREVGSALITSMVTHDNKTKIGRRQSDFIDHQWRVLVSLRSSPDSGYGRNGRFAAVGPNRTQSGVTHE